MSGAYTTGLVAVESADGAAARAAALVVASELASGSAPCEIIEPGSSDLPIPLRERTSSLLTLAGRPLAAGRRVVAVGWAGTMLAYREAHGHDVTIDRAVVRGWGRSGLAPDLTLLIDVSPGRAARRASPAHSGARDALLRMAGHDRVGWRVLSASLPPEALEAAILAEVRWLVSGQTGRWPLARGWRTLQPVAR